MGDGERSPSQAFLRPRHHEPFGTHRIRLPAVSDLTRNVNWVFQQLFDHKPQYSPACALGVACRSAYESVPDEGLATLSAFSSAGTRKETLGCADQETEKPMARQATGAVEKTALKLGSLLPKAFHQQAVPQQAPKSTAPAATQDRANNNRVGPDPLTLILPALAALGGIASIAALNWAARTSDDARRQGRRNAAGVLSAIAWTCRKRSGASCVACPASSAAGEQLRCR
jgi:hypothetical protein